jgi:hypothetical protein
MAIWRSERWNIKNDKASQATLIFEEEFKALGHEGLVLKLALRAIWEKAMDLQIYPVLIHSADDLIPLLRTWMEKL